MSVFCFHKWMDWTYAGRQLRICKKCGKVKSVKWN